jgi:hypothetical protein
MKLVATTQEWVSRYTKPPHGELRWFRADGGEGFVGLEHLSDVCVKIKCLHVFPEWVGLAEREILTEVKAVAGDCGYRAVQALAADLPLYRELGWYREAQVRGPTARAPEGTWLVTCWL